MDSEETTSAQPTLICPACAHGNPSHASFCQGCGVPLRHAARLTHAPSLTSPVSSTSGGAIPNQVRVPQDQAASPQGQPPYPRLVDVDSAVRTAVRAAGLRHLLILLGLIVLIGVLVAGTGTASNIFGMNCRVWGFSGNEQPQHGLLICLN